MELSLDAFLGLLVGNRRPMRWVPKWEAGSDLEKRVWFGSVANDSNAPAPLPEPMESSSCPVWRVMRSFPVPAARLLSMHNRSRARLTRGEKENVEKLLSPAKEDSVSPPTALCHVDESSISAMVPGDIFLIEKLKSAGLSTEPAFHAILACPLCGSQGLVSAAQYFGFETVICSARACSGLFKIIDGERLVYLPVI